MADVFDAIPTRGLRKAHLRQLAAYIRDRDNDGWYYGTKQHFELRHQELLQLADMLEDKANDPDIRLPRDWF